MSGENQNFDFDSLHKLYPQKEGKKKGMEKLAKTIKTTKQYADFAQAMNNYISLCVMEGRDSKYMMRWKTFCNNWEDYVEVDLPKSESKNIALMDSILKGEI